MTRNDQDPETITQFDVDFDDMCGPPGAVQIHLRREFVEVVALRDDTGEEVRIALNPKTARAVGDALVDAARRLR